METMLEYHYWATRRTLEALEALTAEQFDRDLKSSFPSIRATVAHLMDAEATWLGRLTGRPVPAVAPADVPDVMAVRRVWAGLEAEVRAYMAGVSAEDLVSRVIKLRNSTGREFVHPLEEVLHHLFNHGTYHRGQVTTMLRQMGVDAKGTDLIQFYRERSGQLA